jgi:hypothetical protein
MKQFKKKQVLIFFSLLFLFIFVFSATIFYWRKTPPPSEIIKNDTPLLKKQPTPAAKSNFASLSLVPEKQTVKNGQTFLVTINFKTGDFKVDTVDAVLIFDPKILTVEKISEGMFFADYPVKKWEDNKIFLTGTIGAEDKQAGGVKGQGAVGSIIFKAKAAGSTQVSFDQSSLVAREGENVLGETKGATFEIY